MNLSNYPVFKLLLPLMIGIVCSYYLLHPYLPRQGWIWLLFAAILIVVLTFMLSFIQKYRWQTAKSILLSCCYILFGIILTQYRLQSPFDEKEQKLLASNPCWVVRIIDYPTVKAKSVKTLVELQQTAGGKSVRGKVLLYIAKSPNSMQLTYGDVLCVNTSLSEIARRTNPDAFDLRRYMQRRGIFYNGYVAAQSWQKIGHKTPNLLKAVSGHLQRRLTKIFAAAGLTGDEYSVITAILLGDDDTMEPALKAGYAAAGVSHILSVSGMHVGIIYMIINFLLKPMDLFNSTRMGKAFLLLLLIWFYANITGLSPSVTRSAAMFTFVTVGSLLRRNTNIFHSLFASLFILLLINPLLLFEVGFQLSYLAIFGIVLFQKPLTGLYTCKTKIGNHFWELVTVSVAAQIGTFPISIYYFGQFPNYFILANLAVITLSFVIMITGIVLLVTSFIRVIVPLTSWVLTQEIKGMNGIIRFIGELPGAVMQNIDYSFVQVLLLYGFIMALYFSLSQQKKRIGWIAFGFFTVFSGCFFVKKIEILHQQEFVVYSIPKTCAIGFQYQGESVLFSDSIIDKSSRQYQYAIQNHERKRHFQSRIVPIDTPQYDNHFLSKRKNFIQYGGKAYYILKGKERIYDSGERHPIDILIMEHNPKMLPEAVYQIIPFKRVIADETNTPFYIERWRDYCEQAGIDFRYTGKP